jgi:hypothetical protein
MRWFKTAFALALFPIAACSCESNDVHSLMPDIQVDPPEIDLGEVPLGVRAAGTVTVRSMGSTVLTLESVRLQGHAAFKLMTDPSHQLAPTAEEMLSIEATASELGPMHTELLIASDAPDHELVRVPVTMTGVPTPPCDDGNACTSDAFDASLNTCHHSFNDGVACSPADKCVIDAVCSLGVCLGKPKICDDQSTCTQDLCRQSSGECVFLATQMACDDANPCTADACIGNDCVHEPVPSGTPCDDGDLCTTGDSCFAGACSGEGIADGSPCDDLDSCSFGDTCSSGVCIGASIVEPAIEGEPIFEFPLTDWPEAFLHRREVSLSDQGVAFGLDHLPLADNGGLTHVVFAMKQCGTQEYEFAYRPPDSHVLVRFVRREMQLAEDGSIRIVVGVRQLPDDGYEPQTTTYILDPHGNVKLSNIQTIGGETGRSLLPDGSHIFAVIWPLTTGAPTAEMPAEQNLVIVREDRAGNVLWRTDLDSWDWSEFLGVAGPRVLYWADGKFGALDFNTGDRVWSFETQHITKEMALSTALNLGVARAGTQLVGVDILEGRQLFMFPAEEDLTYVPRTDPVIAADGRILVLMQRNSSDLLQNLGLEWVELAQDGSVLSQTPLVYSFPDDFSLTRHEDDPYPTVADDGVAYVGYGNTFWAIDPGGAVRWTRTSSVPNAYTGTVPLLRNDGVMLINEDHRRIVGIKTNGGKMSSTGWASFRHDNRRTNFTP